MQNLYGSHRALVPTVSRFGELFEALKIEFEAIMQDMNVYKMQREDYEHKIQAQINEMTQIQKNIYELERAHLKMKQYYEDELNRFRRELESRGISVPSSVSNVNPSMGLSNGPGSSGGGSSTAISSSLHALNVGSLSQPPNLGSGILSHSSSSISHSQMPALSANFTGSPASALHTGTPGSMSAGDLVTLAGINSGNSNASNQSLSGLPPAKRYRPDDYASQGSHLKSTQKLNGDYTIQSRNDSASPEPQRRSSVSGTSQGILASSAKLHNGTPKVDVPESDPAQIFKKEGADWLVAYNPKVTRAVSIDLMHSLDHGSVVCSVAFSADGKYIATGSNRVANVYDVHTGELFCSLAEDTPQDVDLYIRSVCFNPEGKYLATGAEDRKIRIWDIQQGMLVSTLSGHDQDIYSLQYSKDSRRLASGSGDRVVKLWDTESGKCLCNLLSDDYGAKDSGVTSVSFTPDGQYIAAGSLDRFVRIWNATTGYLVEKLEGHSDSVYSVSFSPDGKKLVSGSLDKTLKIWEFNPNGKSACLSTLSGHKDFVLSVAYSPDAQWIISGSKDRSLQLWDPVSLSTQLMLQGHKNSVISVAMNPKLSIFATGSGDFRARIWKYEVTFSSS